MDNSNHRGATTTLESHHQQPRPSSRQQQATKSNNNGDGGTKNAADNRFVSPVSPPPMTMTVNAAFPTVTNNASDTKRSTSKSSTPSSSIGRSSSPMAPPSSPRTHHHHHNQQSSNSSSSHHNNRSTAVDEPNSHHHGGASSTRTQHVHDGKSDESAAGRHAGAGAPVQSDAQRRENILFMRLATKEQEVQEFYTQLEELRMSGVSGGALRNTLLDPVVNAIFVRMKTELRSMKEKVDQAQQDLNAWKFTPDSTTGKRLMARCRRLIQENEELGKMIETGRIARIQGELALSQQQADELKQGQQEVDDFLMELDDDMEGLQTTVMYLQEQLDESRRENARLRSLLQLNNVAATTVDNATTTQTSATPQNATMASALQQPTTAASVVAPTTSTATIAKTISSPSTELSVDPLKTDGSDGGSPEPLLSRLSAAAAASAVGVAVDARRTPPPSVKLEDGEISRHRPGKNQPTARHKRPPSSTAQTADNGSARKRRRLAVNKRNLRTRRRDSGDERSTLPGGSSSRQQVTTSSISNASRQRQQQSRNVVGGVGGEEDISSASDDDSRTSPTTRPMVRGQAPAIEEPNGSRTFHQQQQNGGLESSDSEGN